LRRPSGHKSRTWNRRSKAASEEQTEDLTAIIKQYQWLFSMRRFPGSLWEDSEAFQGLNPGYFSNRGYGRPLIEFDRIDH
jgi:hypothetical protein